MILKNNFLPPPYILIQNSNRLEAPSFEMNGKNKFAPILLRLSLPLKPCLDKFKEMPYDFFCPSVQTELADRTCKVCSLYFATKKSAKYHKAQVHKRESNVSKTRPLKLIARRENEILCHVAKTSDTDVVAEWLQEEFLDTTGLDVPEESTEDDAPIPIIKDIKDWMANHNPFEEENSKL